MRTRLLLLVATACLAVAVLAAAAIAALLDGVEHAAQLEARQLAATMAQEAGRHPADLQAFIAGLDELYRQDLFIVDRQRITLGGMPPAEPGAPYLEDPDNEVGLTLQDGRPRAFVEVSAQHPQGSKHVVVPLRGPGPEAPITGAVVLEYSSILAQLRRTDAWMLYAVGVAGLVAAGGIGLLYLGFARRLAGGLRALQQGVQAFTQGDLSARIAQQDRDEIGELALAFNQLADKQQQLTLELALAKETAQQAQILAYQDKLTGLANRTELSRLFEQLLFDAAEKSKVLGVLFLDLDRFKNVNDTLGHDSGDRLLKTMGERLQAVCGEDAYACRLGGDEFVVLVPGVDAASWLAGLARRILLAVAQPVALPGQELCVTGSVGISAYPQDGLDERMLMKHADVALYQAKKLGRNGFAFYAPALDRHSLERMALESELRAAVELRQFSLHYQPRVSLSSGAVDGVEALLRWRHPTLGAIEPARFIPVAEETGLIVELGLWALEQACRQQVAWIAQGLPPLKMAVNLSARQFMHEGLLRALRGLLQRTGMAPAALELEITESQLAHNEDRCMAVLHELKGLGIGIAVDDFGTGYSSLAKLKQYPIDRLKIDRAFVRDLDSRAQDRAMAKAIITLGRSMGMSLVAEGVETAAQLSFLQQCGCDLMQGDYFSPALPPEQLAGLLCARQPPAWPLHSS
ncbi:MAG: EAL domain-containing protein [Comamonadaceae bacterium]|nr:EAL domain-containing protein [Comamonadaceae bacterium]